MSDSDQTSGPEDTAPPEMAVGDDTTGNVVRAPTRTGKTLREAIQRARISEVERNDVIVDLREAELARLQLLQDALSEIADELPEDSDLFEFEIQNSATPRLWVDLLAHVIMGRDKRTYRLVQETRHGRQTMLESTDLDEVVARITDYVARRVLERERALAADTTEPVASSEMVAAIPAEGVDDAASNEQQAVSDDAAPAPVRKGKRFGWFALLVVFLLGMIAGAAALFAGSLFLLG